MYGHLFPSLDACLAERLDGAYRAGLSGPKGDQMGTNEDSTVVELETKKNEKAL